LLFLPKSLILIDAALARRTTGSAIAGRQQELSAELVVLGHAAPVFLIVSTHVGLQVLQAAGGWPASHAGRT